MRNYKRGVRIVLVLHINRLADKSMQARKETMGILIKDQRGQIYFKLKGTSITCLGNLCLSVHVSGISRMLLSPSTCLDLPGI